MGSKTSHPVPTEASEQVLALAEGITVKRDRLLASLTLLAGIGLIIMIPFALRAGAEFFMPVTAALVIAVALVPLLEWFERRRIPSKASAGLCVIIFLALAGCGKKAATVTTATEPQETVDAGALCSSFADPARDEDALGMWERVETDITRKRAELVALGYRERHPALLAVAAERDALGTARAQWNELGGGIAGFRHAAFRVRERCLLAIGSAESDPDVVAVRAAMGEPPRVHKLHLRRELLRTGKSALQGAGRLR